MWIPAILDEIFCDQMKSVTKQEMAFRSFQEGDATPGVQVYLL
jgi:hypothetical protein